MRRAVGAARGDWWPGLLSEVDDATSTAQTTGSSITFSHTTSDSNQSMLAGVSIAQESVETVSPITYNGTGLSFVGSEISPANQARIEIWAVGGVSIQP